MINRQTETEVSRLISSENILSISNYPRGLFHFMTFCQRQIVLLSKMHKLSNIQTSIMACVRLLTFLFPAGGKFFSSAVLIQRCLLRVERFETHKIIGQFIHNIKRACAAGLALLNLISHLVMIYGLIRIRYSNLNSINFIFINKEDRLINPFLLTKIMCILYVFLVFTEVCKIFSKNNYVNSFIQV